MSVVAVAGYLPVDGPLPRERMHSLLTVPGVVVETGERWQSGITTIGYDVSPAVAYDEHCESGTFGVKNDGGSPTIEIFNSFTVYTAVTCSTFGTAADLDAFAERAAAVLRATRAHAIENVLAAGLPSITQPYLADANMQDLTSGTAVAPHVGIAHLEDYLSDFGRQGIIHITPAVAASLVALPVGVEGPSAPIYTPAGTPVAIGSGYADIDPDSATGAGAGEDYIYVSGGVQVRLDEMVMLPDTAAAAVDRSINEVTYRAEQIALVSFDTEIQAGALVDWTL